MKIINIPLFISILLLLNACNKLLKPSPNIVQKEISQSNFSSIEIKQGLNLYVTMSNEEKIVIEANENIIPYIIHNINGNHIQFGIKKGVKFRDGSTLNIHVHSSNINTLSGSGGSDIVLKNTITSNQLNIKLSGGSDFDGDVQTQKINIDLSGGSDVSISGNSDICILNASGGSDIEAYDFIVKEYNITSISGGSHAEITALEKLNVVASGGSEIKYKGKPIIKTDISGGSRVEPF